MRDQSILIIYMRTEWLTTINSTHCYADTNNLKNYSLLTAGPDYLFSSLYHEYFKHDFTEDFSSFLWSKKTSTLSQRRQDNMTTSVLALETHSVWKQILDIQFSSYTTSNKWETSKPQVYNFAIKDGVISYNSHKN